MTLITAWNPRSEEMPRAWNLAANRRLAAELAAAGARFTLARGASLPGVAPAWSEDGFALHGATREAALEWGRRHGQRALVRLEAEEAGLLFCADGALVRCGLREFPPDPAAEPRILLRAARDADAEGVIALIGAVYAEHPGNVLDVEREERGLLAPASSFERFWVLERDGEVAGCIAAATREPGRRVELKKCYLEPALRGQGWGRRLIGCVEDHAREKGCREIELWSDTRFTAGHRAYEGLGWRRTGAVRELHDLSRSVEWHFLKRLE